jgi:hypothetical protein
MRSQAQTPKCAGPAMRGAATFTAAVPHSSFPHAEVRRTASEDQHSPAPSIVLAMHQPTTSAHPPPPPQGPAGEASRLVNLPQPIHTERQALQAAGQGHAVGALETQHVPDTPGKARG